MDFVIAATCLRSHNFGIQLSSDGTPFKIKEKAGKIVPAISSSNALVAHYNDIPSQCLGVDKMGSHFSQEGADKTQKMMESYGVLSKRVSSSLLKNRSQWSRTRLGILGCCFLVHNYRSV